MRRIFRASVLCLFLLLVSCKGLVPSRTATVPEKETVIELSFTAWDYKMKGEREFYRQLIQDLEQSHANVKINFLFGRVVGRRGTAKACPRSDKGVDCSRTGT